MCGIAVIAASNAGQYSKALIRMSKSLAHRGPDGSGELHFNNCILAHRRLSIVDLQTGKQPMLSASGHLAVTYNGELYDYNEVKKNLDYPWKTTSDTELLLAAYEKNGKNMCTMLRGMFAFAIWDEKKQRLFCGRDRFGEKPLYYALLNNGVFLVASEIKALLASGLLTPHIDRQALAAYLQLRYVPESISIFKEIKQLAPGQILIFENSEISIKQYWTPPPLAKNPLSIKEAEEELDYLLKKSIRFCLNADVPVGVLLSGGLDSTTIAALATEITSLEAFSFGISGIKNELPFAREAARQYGLTLHEFLQTDMDIVSLICELPEIYDEPIADNSCMPTIELCRHVSGYVKTVLAGDGGDELLGGYKWYFNLQEKIDSLSYVPTGWTQFALAHYLSRRSCGNNEIYNAGLEPYRPILPLYLENSPGDAMRMDIASFLPSDILRKTDRAAMSCGLEIRAPFLDMEVAEFLISLPYNMKLKKNIGKILLRRTYANKWPKAIQKRDKQGFGMTTDDILKNENMHDFVHSFLCDKNMLIYNLFPSEWLKTHTENISGLTWCLLILSVWCENIKKTSFKFNI